MTTGLLKEAPFERSMTSVLVLEEEEFSRFVFLDMILDRLAWFYQEQLLKITGQFSHTRIMQGFGYPIFSVHGIAHENRDCPINNRMTISYRGSKKGSRNAVARPVIID